MDETLHNVVFCEWTLGIINLQWIAGAGAVWGVGKGKYIKYIDWYVFDLEPMRRHVLYV